MNDYLNLKLTTIDDSTELEMFNDQGRGDAVQGDYYRDRYEDCRASFHSCIRQAVRTGYSLQSGSIAVPNRQDDDLTIDWCYLPAAGEKKGLCIISSGVHGIEGFVGSAVQRFFMDAMVPDLDLRHTGILLVHGVNPYGFKYERRVSENNVDLNRNFDISDELFADSAGNDAYATLHPVLNPQRPLRHHAGEHALAMLRTALSFSRHPTRFLVRAVLEGQYRFDRGLYFGGNDFEPQKDLIGALISRISAPYERVFTIDLHSGYGQRGELYLFPNRMTHQPSIDVMGHIFNGFPLLDLDSDFAYTNKGDFTVFLGQLLDPGKIYVPITFDYGTADTHTIRGSIRSIVTMIIENQAHHYGCRSDEDRYHIKRRFRELFYPACPGWGRTILQKSGQIIPLLLKRFEDTCG